MTLSSLCFFAVSATLLQFWRLNDNVRILLDAFLWKELKARVSALEVMFDDFACFHAIELLERLRFDGIVPEL